MHEEDSCFSYHDINIAKDAGLGARPASTRCQRLVITDQGLGTGVEARPTDHQSRIFTDQGSFGVDEEGA